MEPGIVTYVYDGDTFVGHFAVKAGTAPTVLTVWYKHVQASAQSDGLSPERLAQAVLGELVRDDLATTSKGPEPVDEIAA